MEIRRRLSLLTALLCLCVAAAASVPPAVHAAPATAGPARASTRAASATPAARVGRAAPPSPEPIVVWSMRAAGQQLEVGVTIQNRSREPIEVCDQLLVSGRNGLVPAGDALVVINGAAPGEVRLLCGVISPDVPAYWLYPPVFATVPARGTRVRMYRLPLPLRAWHNVAGVAALRGTPTTASLEIAYAAGNIKWATRGSVRDIESARFRGRILGAATAIPSR